MIEEIINEKHRHSGNYARRPGDSNHPRLRGAARLGLVGLSADGLIEAIALDLNAPDYVLGRQRRSQLSSTNRDGEQKDSRRVFGFRPSAIRRIVILGCAGSGKTILARRLG